MASSKPSPKVLAVSLDATSAPLMFAWAREGKLPTLNRLMQEGATARLQSIGDYFPDAIWPTINTGCLPGKHGHYNFRCLRPGTYSMMLAPDEAYLQPFWELMRSRVDGDEPSRLIVFDVQRSTLLREDGVTQVIGWGQRAAQRFESWPPELLDNLATRYERPPRWLDDDVVRRSARAEERYLRTVLRMAEARSRLLRDLLREHEWDFCLASYHETHNGGHVFFRYLEPGTWAYDERRAARFRDALLEIYQAVDSRARRGARVAAGWDGGHRLRRSRPTAEHERPLPPPAGAHGTRVSGACRRSPPHTRAQHGVDSCPVVDSSPREPSAFTGDGETYARANVARGN